MFSDGDGVGTGEKELDDADTPEECIKEVIAQEPTANGVTYGGAGNGKACYAEFGMTHVSPVSSSWRSCRCMYIHLYIYIYIPFKFVQRILVVIVVFLS